MIWISFICIIRQSLDRTEKRFLVRLRLHPTDHYKGVDICDDVLVLHIFQLRESPDN